MKCKSVVVIVFFLLQLVPCAAESGDDLTTLWNRVGELFQAGKYREAIPFAERIIVVTESSFGRESPETAEALNILGKVYIETGELKKAEPAFTRALQMFEKARGSEHPDVATVLNNLGALSDKTGDYKKSEAFYERAIAIREKTLGPDDPLTVNALSNLGALYTSQGKFAKAEPLLLRTLAIREKVKGAEDADPINSVSNLATLYNQMGEYAKAEPLYERALQVREKLLGPEHPDTIPVLNNLAILKIASRATDEALELSKRVERAGEKQFSDILSFTSEKQRLEFQKTVQPYTLFAMLGRAPELADALLRYKGIVLDSLLEDRLVAEASNDPGQREMIDHARSVKQRLWQLELEIPKDLSPEAQQHRVRQCDALAQQADLLEATLACHVAKFGAARRGLGVSARDVQKALSSGQALVECVRYSHYLGKEKWEPRYGAVVIAASEIRWVPLGEASTIEGSIRLYQKSVRGKTDETTLTRVLHELATQVWAPIAEALPPEVRSVIIAPDAELNSISFATLLFAHR
ncbi:MAG TPA: tetratricopeptide repeat protein [Chthoniobacterales bacterium]